MTPIVVVIFISNDVYIAVDVSIAKAAPIAVDVTTAFDAATTFDVAIAINLLTIANDLTNTRDSSIATYFIIANDAPSAKYLTRALARSSRCKQCHHSKGCHHRKRGHRRKRCDSHTQTRDPWPFEEMVLHSRPQEVTPHNRPS